MILLFRERGWVVCCDVEFVVVGWLVDGFGFFGFRLVSFGVF